MLVDSIQFKGYRCFKNEWSGFDTVKPLNVIIGRNNSGKSHLLDLVEAICTQNLDNRGWQYRCRGILDEESLRRGFDEGTELVAGPLSGNLWRSYGQQLVGVSIDWVTDEHGNRSVTFVDERVPGLHLRADQLDALRGEVARVARGGTHSLTGKLFRRLLADRDIQPEPQAHESNLGPDGSGASNVIRRFLLSTDPGSPREIVRDELRKALNLIFGQDGEFSEIVPQLHESDPKDHWEIYLSEETKGLVPLSKSGSGLKTILLVLLNLLVVPKVEGEANAQFVFAFEELENNLHPALLRRLFHYLEDYVLAERATIFLTTHSSTALDFFGSSASAQIIRVLHNGESACAVPVSAHFDRLAVVSELGARPSDLLQANGIVWVEGPSDRTYLNRWIELASDGTLREGRDYQCAFYGGALLARVEFTAPEQASTDGELANLLQVNPNIVVVCDSDRSSESAELKGRTRRILEEVTRVPTAHIWITGAREIENYLPGACLERVLGVSGLPDPGQFESFFPRQSLHQGSYVEARLNGAHLDKMELAMSVVPHLTSGMMEPRFDWPDQMAELVERIGSWNR